jgi:F0F1-type ATP synthase membrane subunit b/b'
VLDERRARSEGAWREAESNRAAALEKVRARQEALKKARAEIYTEQETERRAVLEERTAEIRAARGRTSDEVRTAKERIFTDLAKAQAEIEAQSPALAGEIARVILERPSPAYPSASEAR